VRQTMNQFGILLAVAGITAAAIGGRWDTVCWALVAALLYARDLTTSR
jgi:hypothetical protein